MKFMEEMLCLKSLIFWCRWPRMLSSLFFRLNFPYETASFFVWTRGRQQIRKASWCTCQCSANCHRIKIHVQIWIEVTGACKHRRAIREGLCRWVYKVILHPSDCSLSLAAVLCVLEYYWPIIPLIA